MIRIARALLGIQVFFAFWFGLAQLGNALLPHTRLGNTACVLVACLGALLGIHVGLLIALDGSGRR